MRKLCNANFQAVPVLVIGIQKLDFACSTEHWQLILLPYSSRKSLKSLSQNHVLWGWVGLREMCRVLDKGIERKCGTFVNKKIQFQLSSSLSDCQQRRKVANGTVNNPLAYPRFQLNAVLLSHVSAVSVKRSFA